MRVSFAKPLPSLLPGRAEITSPGPTGNFQEVVPVIHQVIRPAATQGDIANGVSTAMVKPQSGNRNGSQFYQARGLIRALEPRHVFGRHSGRVDCQSQGLAAKVGQVLKC